MNALKTLMIPLLMIITFQLNAQTPHRCHHDEKMQTIYDADPSYELAIEQGFKSFNENGPINNLSANIITIPVHVIIIHPPGQAVGTGDNLSMDHIVSQIDVLNEDFRALNADVSGVPGVFTAGDSEIEFCLASVDPSGNPTDGVTRYGTNQSMSSNEFDLKQTTGWPRSDYLNIWVDPNIGPLGWAYLPSTTGLPNAILDGCVVRTGTFGGPGYATLNPYNLGRTTTHEIGHYLGLRHIWRNDGCGADDGIADTPLQDDENFGCPNHPSPSCSNGGDMFMNYMDYVNDNCMIMFSVDQGAYMRQILNTSRSSLLNAASIKCSVAVPMTASVLAQSDALCFGESSGSVTVNASGGITPYTYSLNGGVPQSDPTFQSLFAGTYTITIFDSGGSQIDVNVIIGEASLMTGFTDFQTDVTCFGGTDGTVTLNALGGTPFPGDTYQYSLNNSPFSPVNVFVDLPAGLYDFEVQDANACVVAGQVTITEPDELFLGEDNISNIACFGEEDGEITLSANGGTPNYTYSLDQMNFQAETLFDNLSPGDYTAYVQDENNCTAEYNFSITEPDVLILDVISQTDIDCNGDSNAEVSLSASGGTPNYQYSENGVDFQSSPDFTDLSAGTYQFIVEDDNACQTTVDVTIDEPEAIAITLDNQTDLLCAGDANGTFSVSVNGGGGTLSYTIDGNANPDGNFSGLSAGDYLVEVTDENNCTNSIQVSITEPPVLTLDNTDQTDIACNGDSDGSISLSANGGSGTYEYELNGQTNTTGQFSALSAGTYMATVTDANNCTATLPVEIMEPTELALTTSSQTDVGCNGDSDGSISLSANGGSGTYEYELNGQTNTTGQFLGLSAGDYTATVTDANNCESTVDFTIEEPAELALSTSSQTDVGCNGDSDGSISLSANGGSGTYEYELNGQTNTTGQFSGLSAGDYTASVTDANNCESTIDFTIAEPAVLGLTTSSQTDVGCNGDSNGSISLSANGGSGTYEYELNGQTNTTGQFSGLSAGDYTATVTDVNNCESTVDFTIAEPAVLTLSLDGTNDLSCAGDDDGSISVSADGGSGNYTYSLSGMSNATGVFENLAPGTYQLAVIDENNCTSAVDATIGTPDVLELAIVNTQGVDCDGGSTGLAEVSALGGTFPYTYTLGNESNQTGLFENLAPGTYAVQVEDANACLEMVDVFIEENSDILLSTSFTDVSCNGDNDGTVQLSGNGGVGTLSYSLDGISNATGLFENLSAGTYLAIVTDENDCSTSEMVTVSEPAALNLSTGNLEMPDCFGAQNGSISALAVGGTGTYTYELNGVSNNTGLFTGLGAGDYSIQVTDENNCVETINMILDQPASIAPSVANLSSANCFGSSDGSVSLTAAGGTGDLTYSLGGNSNGTGVFDGLSAGDYTATVTDANNCSEEITFTVEEPVEMILSLSDVEDVSCTGDSDGMISTSLSGGEGEISYTLGTETNTTGVFANLSAGDYLIMAEDANGCTSTINASIGEPDILEGIIIKLDDVSCNGQGDGSISLTASGGTPGYQFEMNGQTNTDGFFVNMDIGDYSILITDANGCETTVSLTIGEPDPISADVQLTAENDCNGDTNAAITATASGGNGTYTYTLDGQTNDTGIFEGLAGGVYTIEVSDQIGCSTTMEYTITDPAPIELSVSETQSNLCAGDDNAEILVVGNGGSGNYTYSIGGLESNDGVFAGLAAGTYIIEATDSEGCQNSTIFTIEDPAPIALTVTETQNILCAGENTAAIQVGANGGGGDYSYSLDGMTSNDGVFSGLGAGTYEVEVTDAQGCQNVMVFSIEEPSIIEVGLNPVLPIQCNGEANAVVQLFATGGSGTFSYELDGVMNSSGIFDDLAAGTYQATIMDGNACMSTYSFEIEEPLALEVVSDLATPLLCNGDQNATVQVDGVGGTAPYNFMLNNVNNDTGTFEGLGAGDYMGIVTDANNCTQVYEISITEPTAISADLVTQDVLCFGDMNGAISVSATGGTGTLTFEIDGQSNTSGEFDNLGGGNYAVNIIDENNCLVALDATVVEPDELLVDFEMIEFVQCFGDANASVELLPSGGVQPYDYFLSNGQISEQSETGAFFGYGAGTYQGEVIDANGCVTNIDVVIDQPEEVSVDVINIMDDINGDGGGFTLVPLVGNAPFMYAVNGGDFVDTDVFSGLPAGTYDIEVMDASGCSTFVTVTIDLINNTFEPGFGVEDLNIWPNPFKDRLAIELDLVANQRLQMELFTIHGQKVLQQQVELGQGTHLVWLEGMENLPAATFVLSIRNAEKTWYFKVLKQ